MHLNFNLLLHFFVLDGGVFFLKSEEKDTTVRKRNVTSIFLVFNYNV